MTVYLDIIFLENLCMNYIILFATGIIHKNKIQHRRLVLSSILGSIYAVIAYLKTSAMLGNMLLKVLLSIAMIYLAFLPKTPRLLVKELIIFYLTSFAFGGCAFALLYFIKPEKIWMKNGVFIGTYPIKIALLGGIVGFTILVNSFKLVKNKISKKDMFCEVEIQLGEKRTKVKAMIDTGNMLQDPITQMPVLVVEKESMRGLIPDGILNSVEEILTGIPNKEKMEEWGDKQEYMLRFRVIPFSSLGKQHGLLLGFKADSMRVLQEENENSYTNIIVGIYDKQLSKNGAYQALIGLDLLGREEQIHEFSGNAKI